VRKLTLVIFLVLVCAQPVQAQTLYYQGKTVTIVVGTLAGDLYDLYARSIALFMGKYIPGNPNIIVQNMPGAGHMIAAKLCLQYR
jgi:tripartite-type tricarboxylate transporter receptor subunit TctC